MSPEVEGYAASWCRSEPERPGSTLYMAGWNDGLADKLKRDGLYVPPSKAKTKPRPTDDQKISFTRRPPPPGARRRTPSEAQL